jgi:hypothetical protein
MGVGVGWDKQEESVSQSEKSIWDFRETKRVGFKGQSMRPET